MKKIVAILILLAAVNTFAIYVEGGGILPFGFSKTTMGNVDFGEYCPTGKWCSDDYAMSFELNFRVGREIIYDKVWIAGETNLFASTYNESFTFRFYSKVFIGIFNILWFEQPFLA